MSGNLQTIADAIGAVASEVSGIQNVETRPKFTAGRALPAIFVSYDGFKQKPLTFGPSSLMVYDFQLTLYLALSGRDLSAQWDSLLDLSNKIADTFRNSFTLDNIVFKAIITSGRPIIAKPKNPDAKPAWLGHRFQLEVTMEEF